MSPLRHQSPWAVFAAVVSIAAPVAAWSTGTSDPPDAPENVQMTVPFGVSTPLHPDDFPVSDDCDAASSLRWRVENPPLGTISRGEFDHAELLAGEVTYTPVVGVQADGFSLLLRDLDGNDAPPTVIEVSVDDDTPVGGTNDDGPYLVLEDEILDVSPADGVLANDTAVTNILLLEGPQHGTLDLSDDGGFSYTPDPDFFGTDLFVYEARFADVGPIDAGATINVIAVPDVPSVEGDFYELDGDALTVSMADGLLANDVDLDGGTLTAALSSVPLFGTARVDEDGGFTYTAEPGFPGNDRFFYRAISSTGIDAEGRVEVAGAQVQTDNPNGFPEGFSDDQGLICGHVGVGRMAPWALMLALVVRRRRSA